MAREIRFRGRSVAHTDNRLVYGSLVIGTDGKTTYIFTPEGDQWKVDPDTVGQYTGLKDRNGVEVYEGDILQGKYSIGEVEWVQEHAGYRVFARDPSVYHALESDGQLKNTEVIGNRWDHPHLLQEQGEKE